MNLIDKAKARFGRGHAEPDALSITNNDEFAGLPISREEARILARHWLCMHARAKLRAERMPIGREIDPQEFVDPERRYRRLAALLGATELEQVAREVEAELRAPILFRFDSYELDADEPLDQERASWGVCPICHRNDGFVLQGRVAWVYCESHRVAWRVNPLLVTDSEERPDIASGCQRIVGFTVLPQPARLSFDYTNTK